MEFPRHHHHYHHRDDGESGREESFYPPPGNSIYENPPPPPPFPSSNYPPSAYPPPSQFPYSSDAPPPPPPSYTSEYGSARVSSHHVSHLNQRPFDDAFAGSVTHLSHQSNQPSYGYQNQGPFDEAPGVTVTHVSHHSNQPSYVHQHAHVSNQGILSEFSAKPTVKVFCKADPGFSLTIRDGDLILARSNPGNIFQHWYKDEKYSVRVKDEEGCPSFALVNKATGQAIKHADADAKPMQLVPYNPDVLDMSVLWSESKDFGDGYRTIRMVNNIRLNMDAFHGDERSGGVRDGTSIVAWQWNQGDNQLWKISRY